LESTIPIDQLQASDIVFTHSAVYDIPESTDVSSGIRALLNVISPDSENNDEEGEDVIDCTLDDDDNSSYNPNEDEDEDEDEEGSDEDEEDSSENEIPEVTSSTEIKQITVITHDSTTATYM
jgi:hypothetical protein